MIVNGRVTIQHCKAFVVKPINCFSSNKINTDQLRAQLDQLHAEADTTRAKANGARLRLLRLSEAAEKLKRQAAVSLNTGKENDARELLFQKKKVMQAMESSKVRIELLDQLATKLNEAISVKETQLIGNVASDLEIDKEDSSTIVRIVSPKQKVGEDASEDENPPGADASTFGDNSNKFTQFLTDSHAYPHFDKEMKNFQGSLDVQNDVEEYSINSLRGISSFHGFLENLDQQLNNIEVELVTFLNISSIFLDGKGKPSNLQVQQATELLERIRGIRVKVASFMSSTGETS